MPSSSQALLRDVADRWSAWKAGPQWEADALVAIQSATHDVAGVPVGVVMQALSSANKQVAVAAWRLKPMGTC